MHLTLSREAAIAIIKATCGNKTETGAIFQAMIGNISENPPRFLPHWDGAHVTTTGGKTINADGALSVQLESGGWVIFATMQDRTGKWHVNHPLCTEAQLEYRFRVLADGLRLSDDDRMAILGENGLIRRWVKRVNSRRSNLVNPGV